MNPGLVGAQLLLHDFQSLCDALTRAFPTEGRIPK